MDIKPKVDLTKFTAQELQADADGWHAATNGRFIPKQEIEQDEGFKPLVKMEETPGTDGDYPQLKIRAVSLGATGKLANPYGTGNHHRISWRRHWEVDAVTMQATHKPTGFAMAFNPLSEGRYTAVIWSELPPFGPDSTLAMAQMFGLRELLKDGWEIFHTVMRRGQ